MSISRRGLLGSTVAMSSVPLIRARAQTRPSIKLGVLTDSPTFAHPGRRARGRELAIEEMKPHLSFDVELISADHQNKPDVAATIARQWFDQGVAAAIDVPTSSVALAVAQVAKEKDKIMLNASATAAALTDQQCSPNSIVWNFDIYQTRNRPAAR